MLACSCLWTLQFLWYITLFQDIYCRLTKNQHVHCSSLDDWDWVPPKQFNAITSMELTLLSSAVCIRWEDGSGCWPTATHDTHSSESTLAACQATNPLHDRHTHFRSIASVVMDQRTSRKCFQGYLTRLAVRILDPLPVVTLLYPEQIQWLSVRRVFVSRVRLFGACYLSIWEIWIFPLFCSKVNWKHFYSCEPSRALLRLS